MTLDTNDSSLNNDPSVKFGKYLAHPGPDEEIAISGIAGKFPLCNNIEEFHNNLSNKVNLITYDTPTNIELPLGVGLMKDITKFDRGFFGYTGNYNLTLNPMSKILLEKTIECIFDAGLHPSDLEGTKTGVFAGICYTECELHWYYVDLVKNGGAIMGNLRSLFVDKIGHFLKLKGPSIVCDTACSSSLYAFDTAYKAIRMGHCDQALVCGANLVKATGATLQFARLGVLSKEGICKPFDESGKGYVRSEAVSVILLQKAKNCKRIYAKVLHSKTNCDGYKEHGITYPSGATQFSLLKEMYFETGIQPNDMSFIEAHGTGTPVGDPEELNSIDDFFAKRRTKPLLVGSVKSSIGHSEPTSGLCSIIKAILAFETNIIPPNINYKTPRKTIPGLLAGRLKVPTENTPLEDKNGLIGVSSFGFGGANAHVILKWNTKEPLPKDGSKFNLPILVCVSGRTEEAVQYLLNDIGEKRNVEHIALIHNIFRKPIENHLFRGYTLVSEQGVLKTSIKPYSQYKNTLYIYFGGILKHSPILIQELLKFPILEDFKNRIEAFLLKKKISISNLVGNSVNAASNKLLFSMITQLCLAELIKQLEIEYEGVFSNSYGKLTQVFFQNILNLEEALQCVFSLEKWADNTKHNNNQSQILTEFEQILLPKKNIICSNNSKIKRTLPRYLLEAVLQENPNDVCKVSKKSLILEIGQSLPFFKRNGFNVTSLERNSSIQEVLTIVGKLFEYGKNPQVQKLYPKVEFPVRRGTPMISPKIKWKHDYEHFIPLDEGLGSSRRFIEYSISLTDSQWSELSGHVIDGRNLFPATGYLYLTWMLLAGKDNDFTKLKVVFENCKFLRACAFPKASKNDSSVLNLMVAIQNVSGKFEITDGGIPVVTGNIRVWNNDLEQPLSLDENCNLWSKEIMLNSRDIYRELRLRGYHYKGVFRSLTECNKKASRGKIQWTDNWIAFMDNMLQIKILGEDTRLLYVPTSIAYMSIDPLEHLEIINDLKCDMTEKSVEVPVQHFKDAGIIKSGGIEIRGLLASSIPKKKITATPVLEKYMFVPNVAKLSLEQSVRVFMQVALENNCGFNVNVGELIDRNSETNAEPLGPIIQNVLEDQPLVYSQITELTREDLSKTFSNDSLYTVVVGSNLFERNEILQETLQAIVETGYIISREPLNKDFTVNIPGLKILNVFETPKEKLVYLRRKTILTEKRQRVYINISSLNEAFDWLKDLKTAVKKDCDVIAWCQNEPLNGLLGLVNCIKREPGCKNVKTLFIVDQEQIFDPSNPFFRDQLDKNMSVNVFQNRQWGTYRHLLFENLQEVENEHCYVDTTVRGDLSSIKWIEGPLSRYPQLEHNESLVKVYYSSLNFRDVMTASGRINVDVITRDRREQECVQGFEFSGKTTSGKRVMGMVSQGALATLVKADNNLLWEIPKGWSLMDAATVPVVYSTCLYAFVVIGKIKPSDSVLIHSGTGGIGQAAINLCLHMGCTVFTTVGTDEKRAFIKNNFPEIKDSHIGNSRDLSFEQMVMKETNGRGVDIVLNSLAEEKLLATARCLAKNGRFLEIGKFDLANNNQLNMLLIKNGVSFHGVMLDKLFGASTDDKEMLKGLLQNYISSGAVKPLMANIFEKNEVEQAFRFMTAGKHMGKVLVKVREENDSITDTFKGLPRYYCDPNKSYIICGGLGGFGLELADWLVLRGAKHLILTSRNGITTGYQSYRISIWQSYFCNVKIFTHDITTKSGCEELIKAANAEAPVDGIFNLAVVLADALLENQTIESFKTSFGPKAYATEYLDKCTRKLCPSLRDFVVFSSVSCGRGNAGQSNYGMSNSVMERICEKRRREGYPALAIEWGAIGDVGLVAELQEDHKVLEIGGTLQQSIANCLQVLDSLLRQNEASIVSSMVVAEKKVSSASDNILEVVGSILGIRDLKLVSMHSTLAALGMDSMSAVEVKQTLEREYNIFLAPSELRTITMNRIQELHKESLVENKKPQNSETNDYYNISDVLKILLKSEEENTPVCKLKSKSTDKDVTSLPKIIALPGIEGVCTILENLTKHLEAEVYGINYLPSKQTDRINTWAGQLLPSIKELIQPSERVYLMAHSSGASLALEIISQLEALGYLGTLILLDGSPSSNQKLAKQMLLISEEDTNNLVVQNSIIQNILEAQLGTVEASNVMEEIGKLPTINEKLIKTSKMLKFDEEFLKELFVSSGIALYNRLMAILTYKPNFGKLKAKVKLFKPTVCSLGMESEDYDLGQYSKMPIDIKVFEGMHSSFLENVDMAKSIMEIFSLVNGYKED